MFGDEAPGRAKKEPHPNGRRSTENDRCDEDSPEDRALGDRLGERSRGRESRAVGLPRHRYQLQEPSCWLLGSGE